MRWALSSKRLNITKYKNKLKVIAWVLWDYIISSFLRMPSAFCLYLFAAVYSHHSSLILLFRSPNFHDVIDFAVFFVVHLIFCWCRAWTASMLNLWRHQSVTFESETTSKRATEWEKEKKKALTFIHNPHVLNWCSGVLCRFFF